MGVLRRPGLRDLPRRGAPTRDRLPAGDARAAGDHLGRRPRAAGRRQPALERVPGDARRRPHRRSPSRRRTARSRSRCRTPGPGIAPESRERLFRPFVSDSTRRHRPRPRDRQGALRRARRPDRARVRAGPRGALRTRAACRLADGSTRFRAGGTTFEGSAARAASMRASRASIARQPSVSRSTSRPRSSTRAFRSDSISAFQPLEPANRVVREALHLREAPRDRGRLLAQASPSSPRGSARCSARPHAEATVRTGWSPASSTTTCRPS